MKCDICKKEFDPIMEMFDINLIENKIICEECLRKRRFGEID